MLSRLQKGVSSRWRNFYYKTLGVNLRGYVWMACIEIPQNHSDIDLGAGCSLDRGVILLSSGARSPAPKISIGESTYINRNTFIDASLSIRIGRRCAIGPSAYITDHDHGMEPNLPPLEQPLISKATEVGDCVWIGANATILKGVTVGESAVIGAGSVVTKNVPAGAVVAGTPARLIKYKTGFSPALLHT